MAGRTPLFFGRAKRDGANCKLYRWGFLWEIVVSSPIEGYIVEHHAFESEAIASEVFFDMVKIETVRNLREDEL